MLITYKKRNGEVFQRIRNTYPGYRVGDVTSMGWTVLDIQYKWKNKYYTSTEYDKLINKSIKQEQKIRRIKKLILQIYHNLSYTLILLILLRTFELMKITIF